MATKTVNLSEEAYGRLVSLKREGESFSDVVNRITGKYALLDLVGVLSPEEADVARERIRALRRSARRALADVHRRIEP